MSRIWMSWRIQYLLAWRCDLWRTIVCLRLPFWFLSVSCLCCSLCYVVSFSFCICVSPFLHLLSPFLPFSLTLYPRLPLLSVALSSPLSLISVSASLSQCLPLCLCLCLSVCVSSPSSIIFHLFPSVSLRISQISTLCIRSPIFTIYHFALIR